MVLREIKKTGYQNAIRILQQKAEKLAGKSNTDLSDLSVIEGHIHLAERCAKKIKESVPHEVLSIKYKAYEKAIPLELAETKKFFDNGKEMALAHAELTKKYARLTKQDVRGELSRILGQ